MEETKHLLRQIRVLLFVALVVVAGAVIRGEQVGHNADRARDAATEARDAARKTSSDLTTAIRSARQSGNQEAVAEVHSILMLMQNLDAYVKAHVP